MNPIVIVLPILLLLMFGLGLSFRPGEWLALIRQPKAVWVGLAAQMLVLPLLALGLVWWFRPEPYVWVGLMLIAASPGGSSSNILTLLAKGDAVGHAAAYRFAAQAVFSGSGVELIRCHFTGGGGLRDYLIDFGISGLNIAALTGLCHQGLVNHLGKHLAAEIGFAHALGFLGGGTSHGGVELALGDNIVIGYGGDAVDRFDFGGGNVAECRESGGSQHQFGDGFHFFSTSWVGLYPGMARRSFSDGLLPILLKSFNCRLKNTAFLRESKPVT